MHEQLFDEGFRSYIHSSHDFLKIFPKNTYTELKEYLKSLIQKGVLREDAVKFDIKNSVVHFKYSFKEMIAFLEASNNQIVDARKFGRLSDTIYGTYWILNNLFQDRKEEELLENAKVLFRSIPSDFFSMPSMIPLEDFSRQAQEQVLKSLYTQYNGIPIGECHTEQTAKQFLINHAEKLKSLGVQFIFLEHFSETMQLSLNHFFETGEMPKDLFCYVNYLDMEFKLSDKAYNFLRLLLSMQKNGIKPIAIETTYTYVISAGLDGNPKHRMLAMNYQFYQNLENVLQIEPRAKWTALVGSAHVTTHHCTPGISELLQCPAMVVNDTKVEQSVLFNYEDVVEIDPDSRRSSQVWFRLYVHQNKFVAPIKKVKIVSSTLLSSMIEPEMKPQTPLTFDFNRKRKRQDEGEPAQEDERVPLTKKTESEERQKPQSSLTNS